jgi:cobaltochelatase CobT
VRLTAASILGLCIAVFMLAGLSTQIALPILALAFFGLLRAAANSARQWRARHRRNTMPERFDGPYRVFTTAYDRQLQFDQLPALLARQKRYVFAEHTPTEVLEQWADACEPAIEAAATRMASASDLAVTLLLDHSGSLRGSKSCLMATAASAASDCLTAAAIAHEVLAFTTVAWRGGQAKQRWLSRGAPRAPGRLCDLLHIVYRSGDEQSPLTPQMARQMTDDRLLKENVDGEAVLWAAARLRAIAARRRILFVVSDGAPVDDATLLANGPNILDDHLTDTLAALAAADDIEIYGIGIQCAMHRYYSQYAVIEAPEDIGQIFLPILAAVVSSDAHRALSA